jgi:hypothetical protein
MKQKEGTYTEQKQRERERVSVLRDACKMEKPHPSGASAHIICIHTEENPLTPPKQRPAKPTMKLPSRYAPRNK